MTPFVVGAETSQVHCVMCRRAEPSFKRALAYGSYEGGLRELIHLLKYDNVRPAATVLGRMLNEVICELESGFSGKEILLIPVPLHKAKQRQREFNQAEIIASAALKMRKNPRIQLRTDLLERRRPTQSQIGLSSHQRRENLRGAFAVAAPQEIKEREILLVDDVFTTGTTVSECARVLRRAGATKVWVATVARTLKFEVQSVKLGFTDEQLNQTMAAAG